MNPGPREYLDLYWKILHCRIRTWLRHREIIRAFETLQVMAVLKLYIVPLLVLVAAGVLTAGAIRALSGATPASLRAPRIPKAKSLPGQISSPSQRLSVKKREPAPPQLEPETVPLTVTEDVRTALVANKATRRLLVYECRPGAWKEVSSFPVAVGKFPGRKQMQGDRRTPEGIYYIIGRRIWRPVSPTYGPLSYILNYPNDEDREAGHTGDGIWIHTAGDNPQELNTRGCLGMSTPDLISLARHLGVGIGTPVVVVDMPDLERPDLLLDYDTLKVRQEKIIEQYRTRLKELAEFLDSWKTAWESRDIGAFSRFYDTTDFFGQGMRWKAWRRSKQRTFERYSFIQVTVDEIVAAEYTDTNAVVEFLQDYRSDAVSSQNRKEMILARKEGEWKIFREEAFAKETVL